MKLKKLSSNCLNKCRKRDEDSPASAAQLAAVTGSPQNRPICAIERTTRGAALQPQDLFTAVRTNHFRMYFHYMYFDAAKWSYLQAGVLVPYIALAPSIVAGAFTLGVMEQIARAFSQVQESFQYLVRSWSSIVELVSVFKRLRAFEKTLH